MHADLDSDQLRRRQVEVVAQALSRFVALKSSADEWQGVAPVSSGAAASMGGDIDVHVGRKAMAGGDVYRMTASIALDAEAGRDTLGPFSAYLSELRDWQAVLECPELRSQWNYFLRSSTTLEMVDVHTAITRSQLRSPVPGQTGEFAHARDLLMVETSLVDPTTVVHVATSLPTTADDPAYLRPAPPTKRVHSDLWAWCVEIATPLDATPTSSPLPSPAQRADQPSVPRACVQVTCFLHLDLGSWATNNALACRAAANLIPALVAHLRLQGAPPRLARVGPLLAVDRREWRAGPTPVWELALSASSGARPSTADQQQQPIIARVLDLESADPQRYRHGRRESSLTTYLSSSIQRQQGEESAMGSHAGGIIRDGEEEAVVATRARLGKCVVEFVVDATRWHAQDAPADIRVTVHGASSARQLQRAIWDMKTVAPELFADDPPAAGEGAVEAGRGGEDGAAEMDRVAAQLVRCYTIGLQRGARHRYLVRMVNVVAALAADSDAGCPAATADRSYYVEVSVRMGSPGESARLLVNGRPATALPFSLGPAPPPVYARTTRPRAKSESCKVPPAQPAKLSLALEPREFTPASYTPEAQGDSSQPESSMGSALRSSQETRERDTSGSPETREGDASGPQEPREGDASGSLETPLARLRQACAIPAEQWELLGTTNGVAVSRAVVRGSGQTEQQLPDGAILRASVLVEGWTVFDVQGVLRAGEPAGLWAEEREIAQTGATSALFRCATRGSWAVAARDAVVCRAWTANQRSRAEVAECSVEAPAELPSIAAREPIRAMVGLAAWALEKATPAQEERRDTGTPAVDAEVASRRRKQHAARITFYLQYSPRGWLDSTESREPGQPWMQPWLQPWLRSEMAGGVARIAERLDAQGAPPAVVWQRNAALLGGDGARYRLAPWGNPSEDVEVELRIEHRVWAYGAGGNDGASPASVALEIAPLDAASSVACFVDPEADPHATRVRVRHRRALLLPRAATKDGAPALAWPVVSVAVTRAGDDAAAAAAPARSWSVPPRVTVNGTAARVRFLRRECDSAFYARCQSVAVSPRLVRAPGDPFVELVAAAPAATCPSPAPSAAMAIRSYSVQPLDGPTVERPADFAAAVARAFAHIRHEIGLLDAQSARSRWTQLRASEAGADVRRARWEQQAVGGIAVYERIVPEVHPTVPVTAACVVMRGVCVARVAQLLTQPWERARWDCALFADRRLVESTDGASVWHSAVRAPTLAWRRDALTVAASSQGPHLPTRLRLRNWQRRREPEAAAGCGLGDYFDPAVTVVEASVPGAQPLASAVRASVPLFAVRLDPVDGHERARGHGIPYPSTRVTVACCVDLAGSLPLPLRRVLSAKVPAAHLSQLADRLHRPLWPRLDAPSPLQRLAPLPALAAVGEASEETVDGQPAVFYRAFDAARIVRESLEPGGVYIAAVHVPGARPAGAVDAHVTSLRKERGAEPAPLLPVVSDIVVDARRFPRGFEVHVAIAPPGPRPPVARPASGAPAAARAVVGSGAAVYVFGLGADHSAPLGADRLEGAGQWAQFLVRTVLLPDADVDVDAGGDDDDDLVCTVAVQAAHGHEAAADVVCNGQRLRVHAARPARRSLLLVDTGDAVLTLCPDCGGVGCQDAGTPMYASDTASEAEVPPSRAGSQMRCGSAAPPTAPRVPSSSALCATPATVRRRRLATPCEIPSSEIEPCAAPACGAGQHRRAARVLLAALSLAVFLPLRRLVIGSEPLAERVRQWAVPSNAARPQPRPAAKSTLALVLVLAVGAACLYLGAGAARLVYAPHHRPLQADGPGPT
ncbi:hypothetical protein LPJ61_001031 [Coemansia biformis]|uniref:START domain-containing protein n=1 Tax=Coemansia biformis TaxID=1286918 RepID=A0A9W7YII2_9FUNG|nr:hypothetical protein LPJ61_001031 [Coemansia biformis]